MAFRYASRTVFIFGVARSGTTWLGKIFDSHPGTVYRHEPDMLHRDFPAWIEQDEPGPGRPMTEQWLEQLVETRAFRSVRVRPIFAKRFHSPLQRAIRRAMIAGLSVARPMPGATRLVEAAPVPDFVDLNSTDCCRVVIKSVTSPGRTCAIARAAPESRFVFILRHPCGYAASQIRGIELAKFANVGHGFADDAAHARRRNLTRERFKELPLIERIAWDWVIENEKMLEDLRLANHLMVIRYEDIVADPVSQVRELFEFCGLEWNGQTEQFLAKSTQHEGGGYYEVMQDSMESAFRWKKQLSAAEIDQICRIALDSVPGRMCLESELPSMEKV